MQRGFIQRLAEALYRASEGKSRSEIDVLARRSAELIASKRLLRKAPALFTELETVRRAQEKKIQAVITSRHQLTPADVKAIAEHFEKIMRKEIEVELVIDPKLLGGFKVRCGDVVFDATVDRSLKQLVYHLTTKE